VKLKTPENRSAQKIRCFRAMIDMSFRNLEGDWKDHDQEERRCPGCPQAIADSSASIWLGTGSTAQESPQPVRIEKEAASKTAASAAKKDERTASKARPRGRPKKQNVKQGSITVVLRPQGQRGAQWGSGEREL